MLSELGEILGNAIGVAVSPVPIIALILMLFSASAARNSIAFVLGWVTALTGVGLVVLAIGLDSSSGGESDASGWIKIVLGPLLLALAVEQWRTRPTRDEEPAMPGWMSAIDEFSAIKAFGVALLLAGPNPKNLALTVAAASTGSGAGLSSGQEATTMLLVRPHRLGHRHRAGRRVPREGGTSDAGARCGEGVAAREQPHRDVGPRTRYQGAGRRHLDRRVIDATPIHRRPHRRPDPRP